MTEMPEKIWAVHVCKKIGSEQITAHEPNHKRSGSIPYTRTDLYEAVTAERDALRAEVEKAFLAGFKASGEGFNAEYPCEGYSDAEIWDVIKPMFNAFKEGENDA